MKIINHRLHKDDGTPFAFRAVPGASSPVIKPRWLVMHYTADSGSAALNWFTSPANTDRIAAHIVIAKDGTITQCVPFNRKANHAGPSKWKDVKGLNSHSIGIEMVGFGIVAGGPGKWKAGGKTIPDSDVLVGHPQVRQAEGRVDQVPAGAAGRGAGAGQAAGAGVRPGGRDRARRHRPRAQADPGPAFPMESFRAACLQKNARPESDPTPAPAGLKPIERFRVKTTLNVRGGPGASNATVAGSPLQPGAIVRGAEDRTGGSASRPRAGTRPAG